MTASSRMLRGGGAALVCLATAGTALTEEPAAQFRVGVVGDVEPGLANQVLATLRGSYREFSERLGFAPRGVVEVVLSGEVRLDATRYPAWADGINDGAIRVPVGGVAAPDERLRTLIRHELAHSFVTSRTRGNCPTWLQEGIAQWLEGGDPEREDRQLARELRTGRGVALLTLEAPFQDRGEADVRFAYAASLSATAHLLRTRGVEGVVRLLESLGAGVPSEEALPLSLGMSYAELQRTWEGHLADVAAKNG